MPSAGHFPVRRLWDGFVVNRVHPTLWPLWSGRSPDRSAFVNRLPTHDASNNQLLPVFWGAFYRSPISHYPAWIIKI
jgi:hypothetical protein